MNEAMRAKMFAATKQHVADLISSLMHAGIPDHVCLAALGSVAGNLIGLNHEAGEHAAIIDSMKDPMLSSAKEARDLKDLVIRAAL